MYCNEKDRNLEKYRELPNLLVRLDDDIDFDELLKESSVHHHILCIIEDKLLNYILNYFY